LRRDCIVAVEDGLFVDQRWVDFVPALFEHEVIKDPGCNVAYWNLSHRQLGHRNGRWEVDGGPLRFFHYSGFSPDRIGVLSAHMGSIPRILLHDRPELRRLCDAYAERLRGRGFGAEIDETYPFDALPNGLAIDPTARRDIRQAMVDAERDGESPAPDPFDDADLFLDWLAEPSGDAGLPRYLAVLHRRRGGVRRAFPDVTGSDRARLLDWASTRGQEEGDVASAVLERALPQQGVEVRAPSPAARMEGSLRSLSARHPWLSPLAAAYRALRGFGRRIVGAPSGTAALPDLVVVPSVPPLPGITLAGYLRAELGVGEAARRLARALEAGHIPHTTVAYGRTQSRQQHAFVERGRPALYDTNVVCVNADQLPNFRRETGALFDGRYTIGLWFWEVDRFPAKLHGAFDLVDEVWAASDFVAEAVLAEATKPVLVVPLPVEAPPPTSLARSDVGLPGGFVFLFCFDFLSVVERKNPHGLVEAFERAFTPGEGPTLVIKTINGARRPDELALLERRTAHREDILIVDGYVTAEERDAVIALCDCYVSLHRSEGYGLTMAEAMALGRPVIATGYSGNLSFMDEQNSLLVPHHLVSVPSGCDPYPPGAHWAEPDLDSAAVLLRRVFQDPAGARELGRLGREDILRRNTPLRTAELVRQRLGEIRIERSTRASQATLATAPGAQLLGAGGRRPVRFARRLLQRLLWPYLAKQRAFDEAVADALRAHEAFAPEQPEEDDTPASTVTELAPPDRKADPAARTAGVPGG
jgi:glycosyltransferase involved in cell wall biosynthesis